ncbi:hypothetical protein GCWU000341_00177 [Oribacterium sp. oral taxon 078 str. F0262]|nr:hypothetical protein GCWU000341_00177 [Oribacterium sp. oral taxon 078 str. F0262]
MRLLFAFQRIPACFRRFASPCMLPSFAFPGESCSPSMLMPRRVLKSLFRSRARTSRTRDFKTLESFYKNKKVLST